MTSSPATIEHANLVQAAQRAADAYLAAYDERERTGNQNLATRASRLAAYAHALHLPMPANANRMWWGDLHYQIATAILAL